MAECKYVEFQKEGAEVEVLPKKTSKKGDANKIVEDHIEKQNPFVLNLHCPQPGCTSLFKYNGTFRAHVETHFCFPCTHPRCMKKFKNNESLQEHIETHFLFRCTQPQCNERFINIESLQAHVESHFTFRCTHPRCMKRFKNIESFQAHFESHLSFICTQPQCKERFYIIESFQAHVESHFTFHCTKPQCKERFTNSESLQTHVESHFPFRNTLPGCTKRFESNESLQAHNTLNHAMSSCDQPGCNKLFLPMDKNSCIYNNFVCTKSDGTCSCRIRETNYPDLSSLDSHLKTYHISVKCSRCKQEFISSYAYDNHIDATNNCRLNVLGIEAPCIFTIKIEDDE